MTQRASSPVLVGRGVELAQLRAFVDRTLTGTPATVVLAGEAGVGKTRLLGALLDHAQEQRLLTLAGGCLDVGDGVVAYAPVVEALRGWWGCSTLGNWTGSSATRPPGCTSPTA